MSSTTIDTDELTSGFTAVAEAVDERRGLETIWSLVEKQAEAHPQRAAIDDHGTEIDYQRLVERAGAIAGELAARGVEPGSLVGVCMSRTWELAATLLGILRAGCAYVPLDPAYPRERVRTMLEDSRAACAVVDHEQSAQLCAGVPRIIRLGEVGERTADGVAEPGPRDLAYVLYTSGSTGRPKGVAVEHRSVVTMCRSLGTLLDDEELAGVLASASICFDASVLDLLGVLTLGGTVVLAENVLDLLELPSAERVRTIPTVPTAMQTLIAAGPLPAGLRCAVFGGEVLKRSLVDQLRAQRPGLRVFNVYGPTEATVYATATEVAVGAESITIGKPIPGTRAYVLDDSLRQVPVGEPGELYLAGEQLARGYLHEEELTRERFLERDPDRAIPETRLYKTGDLCRLRDDGELEFLGRVDQQVKVRGFRVELEEIESMLETMDDVKGAAATLVDGADGRRRLVAYVTSHGQPATGQPATGRADAARGYLAERLPAHLVPQVVLHLDELPRLPNGKLDREALPAPDMATLALSDPRKATPAGSAGDAVTATRPALGLEGLSPDEQQDRLLAVVRSEIASLLRLDDPEQVPAHESVFDLGLDSLTVVELSSRLAAVLGRKLPARVIMERATPAAVAEHLLGMEADAARPAVEEGARDGAVDHRGADKLGSFQAQIRACYPPFLAAKAASWSVNDKAKFVHELKRLVSGFGQDPHSKIVRTGSAHRGRVADVHTRTEREAIIWTTNLYLGLNRDREVIEAAGAAVERFGTGMGTSAVAGGVTDLHLEFEHAFAELVGKPAALLFPTGYTANLGVVAGLLGADDVVVMDQLCHASIVDGARLSGAKIRTFQHNSAADLETVLRTEASPHRTVLVILEGVYSMGEGAAAVEDIARTAKRHGALVLVDEAHSFGFYGPRGAGLCAERGVTGNVDFIMTTLSKALGSLGGVIAASEEHIDLLRSSARAYIFQASTSPAAIAAALTALRRLRDDDSLRERLWDTTRYMRRRFTEAGYDLGPGDTPVVTPHFSDKDKLFAIVDGLYARGVLTSAVTYPVVEAGRGRLRFICSAAHTRDDVDHTLEALIEAEREADAELERQAARESAAPAPGERAALEAWADAFAAHLRGDAPEPATSVATPDLAISVELPAAGEPVTITLEGGELTVKGREPGAVENGDSRLASRAPSCTVRLEDARAFDALRASDVQGLLDCMLSGSCVLSGQVEPFVWLVARLTDWQPGAAA